MRLRRRPLRDNKRPQLDKGAKTLWNRIRCSLGRDTVTARCWINSPRRHHQERSAVALRRLEPQTLLPSGVELNLLVRQRWPKHSGSILANWRLASLLSGATVRRCTRACTTRLSRLSNISGDTADSSSTNDPKPAKGSVALMSSLTRYTSTARSHSRCASHRSARAISRATQSGPLAGLEQATRAKRDASMARATGAAVECPSGILLGPDHTLRQASSRSSRRDAHELRSSVPSSRRHRAPTWPSPALP